MAKESRIININGKRMNVLEAEAYYFWIYLKKKKLKLVDEEKQGYLEWKFIREDRNIAAERNNVGKIYKDFSEKTYLIETLKNKICAFKEKEKKEYCKRYGHKEKKNSAYTPTGIERSVTHYKCANCGMIYEKRLDK
jgi:hypothetical protein